MRVLLPHNECATTGKGKFALRLVSALRDLGVDVVTSASAPHDIYLDFIRFRCKSNAPKVLRLNGVYNDLDRPSGQLNRPIIDALHRADGVIYQSGFSKALCDRYLFPVNVPSRVIWNGAYRQRLEREDKRWFVAFFRDRPHKRKADIEACAKEAGIPIIVGSGEMTDSGMHKAMAQAYGMIHLCWQDNCPNSVVEAICAGLPVICNNVGGTHEIVAPSGGTVCMVDPPYGLEMCHLYQPPPVDHQVIADAMWDIVKRPPVVKSDHVEIGNIARQYKAFLEGIL